MLESLRAEKKSIENRLKNINQQIAEIAKTDESLSLKDKYDCIISVGKIDRWIIDEVRFPTLFRVHCEDYVNRCETVYYDANGYCSENEVEQYMKEVVEHGYAGFIFDW